MSSQITHTHTIINIHHLAHILDICALIFSSCSLFTVYPNRISIPTASVSQPQPPEHGRTVRKNTLKELIQLHIYKGSLLFPIFRALTRSLQRRSSVAQGHLHTIHPATPSIQPHHPSSLVPALHLPPPSKPIWPYGTHPSFPHVQTVSILSDLLYSLTPSLFQLFISNSIHS